MYGMSIGHWIIVIGVIVLLFGRNKISHLMKDVGEGIRNLKFGMKELEK